MNYDFEKSAAQNAVDYAEFMDRDISSKETFAEFLQEFRADFRSELNEVKNPNITFAQCFKLQDESKRSEFLFRDYQEREDYDPIY